MKTKLMLRVEKRFKKSIVEILYDLYIKQKHSQRKCAVKLNVGKTTIAEWMRKFGIPQRDSHQPKSKEHRQKLREIRKRWWKKYKYEKVKLSERGIQIFLGSLLGDGSLCISKNGKHAYFKEEYLRWKNKHLNFTFKKYKHFDKRFNREYISVLIYSRASPFFTKFYRMLYHNGKKCITKEFLKLLKPLGLAIFYCDDGNLRKDSNYISISSEGFDKKSLKILIYWLKERWEIDSELNKKHNIIIIRSKKTFVDLIKPFISSCMNYKVNLREKKDTKRIDRGMIRKLYKKMEDEEIAEKLNCHPDSIWRIRKEMGLLKRRNLKPENVLKFLKNERVTTSYIMSKLNICRAYTIFLLDALHKNGLVEKTYKRSNFCLWKRVTSQNLKISNKKE